MSHVSRPLTNRTVEGRTQSARDRRAVRPPPNKKAPLDFRERFGLNVGPGFAVLTAIGTLRPTGRRPAISENLIYGAEGSRTPGLCSAIAALSQLSYSPETWSAPTPSRNI